MPVPADRDWIRQLPKAELHLHLEGTLEPEHMFALAARNRVDLPFRSVEEVRAAYQFQRLDDFLAIYYQGTAVLQTEQDFFELTARYLDRARADGVRHVEVFFDPQAHTRRGVEFGTVVRGIVGALAQSNITSRLILCFLRDLSEFEAFETLASAEPYLEHITGIGLDSSELGHPPGKLQAVFEAARDRGLRLVAHAGEEGPPAYVREALDVLHIERIDHGNRALEDPQLVERLRESQIALTVCPLSNLKLGGVSDLRSHPLRQMLDLGLRATVNSDDPAYFGGYVVDNLLAVVEHLRLSDEQVVTLARNSFSGSFLDSREIDAHLRSIDEYVVAPKR
ncbi:MAG: adenosine deaminase [Steroidobacter sp.]